MRTRKMASIALLLLLVPGAAVLGEDYWGLGVGVFLPNDDSEGLELFETGYTGDVYYGLKLLPNVALEFGVGYYGSDYELSTWGGDCEEYPCVIGSRSNCELLVVPVSVTVKYLFHASAALDFYLGGGFGYYFCKITDEDTLIIADEEGNRWEENAGKRSVSDEVIGFHAAVGCDIMLSDAVCLGCDARYARAVPSFDWGEPARKEDVNLGGFMLGLNLKYTF